MANQIDPDRLRRLRDQALRYLRLHGAGQPKGYVPVTELQAHLGTNSDEYHALYLLLYHERLARTDGMNVHFALTDAGRNAADRLPREIPMPNQKIDPQRLKDLRDKVLLYVYEHGAGEWGWCVKREEVKRALGIDEDELRNVHILMINQGLHGDNGLISDVCLSEKGQEEAVRLGAATR